MKTETAHVQNSSYDMSNLLKLTKEKKRHKEINNQIHIYSHKAQFNVKPLIRKSSSSQSPGKKSSKQQNQSLPSIINGTEGKGHLRQASTMGEGGISSPKNMSSPRPKFSLEEEKEKIRQMKMSIEQAKEKRIKEAKNVKEANRLMRENIAIYKDFLKDENVQKKKIVDAKYQLIKKSISNYKDLKKSYLDHNLENEIKKERQIIQKKENELMFWKMVHENKIDRNSPDLIGSIANSDINKMGIDVYKTNSPTKNLLMGKESSKILQQSKISRK
jgi:hypothetical protein